ncbi:SDR family NAD(P)-dependent oxidoreductase [Rhizobium halophytocola]|uniref:NAD(P)-dependent dehydrogenase (Short-subunit alcohol dehydrogenase family) n=1 Tax=Rhizobium halophytocola TaxID=735519 RepID=A0ABS4DXA0_9HYPH|nr:glucose 1-dehydrogenase [Rhizobium halophytocola]MBP1850319.1 NAD(P)-dependent dehydrogenase (short-subunit alcohol dehydrogenase family) [Rhizobium halophytocola]
MTDLSQRMKDRVCLVTGGGTGIGRAAALQMAREGAVAVVIAARRREEGEAAAAACRAEGCESLFVPTDVSQESDVARMVETTIATFGRLDAVFNNAGYQERRAPLEEQTAEVYASVFDTNVRGVFFCLRHQIPAMVQHGAGTIVVNASVSGIRNPNPGFSLYNASKAAVIAMTRTAALENAARGIRINAVAPGRVVTDMMLSAGVGDIDTVARTLPLKRMGTPQELAEATVWLLSDQSSYVVGHVLAADGGFLAG